MQQFKTISTQEEKALKDFIASRLKSLINCNGLKGREAFEKALTENQSRWIGEFIAIRGR